MDTLKHKFKVIEKNLKMHTPKLNPNPDWSKVIEVAEEHMKMIDSDDEESYESIFEDMCERLADEVIHQLYGDEYGKLYDRLDAKYYPET